MQYVNGVTKSAPGGGTSANVDMTGADLIVVGIACSWLAYAGVMATFSDSQTNTWTNTGDDGQADGQSNCKVGIVFCVNPSVSNSMNFSIGGGSQLQAFAVAGYRRANLGYYADVGGASTGQFTVQAGSITPSQNNGLLIFAATVVQTSPVLSIDQGFTIRQNQLLVPSTSYGVLLADLFQGQAAAVNPTLTSDQNTNAMGARNHVFLALPNPFCQILG